MHQKETEGNKRICTVRDKRIWTEIVGRGRTCFRRSETLDVRVPAVYFYGEWKTLTLGHARFLYLPHPQSNRCRSERPTSPPTSSPIWHPESHPIPTCPHRLPSTPTVSRLADLRDNPSSLGASLTSSRGHARASQALTTTEMSDR